MIVTKFAMTALKNMDITTFPLCRVKVHWVLLCFIFRMGIKKRMMTWSSCVQQRMRLPGLLRRKQGAEILLLESEVRFRQIVENASDIIYRADMNGDFTYANPSALKLMGFTNERDVVGKNYLDLTTPEFRNKLKRVYDHQYLSKTQSTYYEFPAVTMDGEVVWVGQNVQLIMDGDQVIGFQAVARNITQLKQAQEALALVRNQHFSR